PDAWRCAGAARFADRAVGALGVGGSADAAQRGGAGSIPDDARIWAGGVAGVHRDAGAGECGGIDFAGVLGVELAGDGAGRIGIGLAVARLAEWSAAIAGAIRGSRGSGGGGSGRAWLEDSAP